ncbi:MAG TPA: DUF4091 domain-containing protein [Candidatus Hydrogenedentes bacterium]|nr:DUF4091 domain-containing protein [Candidatus Hydrogenedentota bacterium]
MNRTGMGLLGWALLITAGSVGQTVEIRNPSFAEGEVAPTGWTLSGGQGMWAAEGRDDARSISVTGTGGTENSNFWVSEPPAFEPNKVYRLRFFARSDGASSGGTPISGPFFCNRDLGGIPNTWTEFISIFAAPARIDAGMSRLRFGQWERSDTVFFDAIELVRADPIYMRKDGFTLGEGERIAGHTYTFTAPYYGESRNQARPLVRHQGAFNTLRWIFPGTEEVVYRHEVGRRQTEASVSAGTCWYKGGEVVVEAGRDGEVWQEIGAIREKASRTFALPESLFPAETVWIRLRPRPDGELPDGVNPGSMQIDAYGYRATLEGAPVHLNGATRFAAVKTADPRIEVKLTNFGECVPGGDNTLEADILNTSNETIATRPTLTFAGTGAEPEENAVDVAIKPGRQSIRLPYRAPNAGKYTARFSLGSGLSYRAEMDVRVPDLHETSYGWRLPQSSDDLGLWWCRSGWKISRSRPLPDAVSEYVSIQAAANEADAAQIVLRPNRNMQGLRVHVPDLRGPGDAMISAERVEVLRVRYVTVEQPTDAVGAAAPWPDPLPPLKGPLDLEAGTNQPLWIRVAVPADTPGGVYSGVIRLETGESRIEIPLRVTVFGFALPDRMTCTSAFGFSPNRVFVYQKLATPEQKRAVLDMYWANFAAHRISPYDPAPLDPFTVTWPVLGDWTGHGLRDRSERFAGESALFIEDASPTMSAEHTYAKHLAISSQGFRLRFMYKTREAGQEILVTFTHFDKDGTWMTGRNKDIVLRGDGTWQSFDAAIESFPENARSARFTLRPVLWAEDGSTVGAAWFDNVSIQDAATGEDLVSGGDFEPIDPGALVPSFDWTAWDAAMTCAMDTYHFNSFRLPIQGMGGGTFHERWEPSLLGYGEHTPEYQAAFRGYCRSLQEHLREKGWLPYSYVYWFDEPEPRDYEFVMNGFRRLKDVAPDLPRMLTEQVEPALVGGPNIWCPLTPAYSMEAADARRAEGDRFWWYVCCGPKEPYCTLFLDHPAVELRVWLWQTWQRKIDGILVWETNYWNSRPAYPDPDHPQNPYEDTMSWTEGYGTPPGTKLPWGNGDGRFIYPPEAAADGRPADPVLEGPVDSIRWEMLRDGIEDYEYLAILRRMIDERGPELSGEKRAAYSALLEVPADITSDLTTFTRDPEPIEKRRETIARAIESLAAAR